MHKSVYEAIERYEEDIIDFLTDDKDKGHLPDLLTQMSKEDLVANLMLFQRIVEKIDLAIKLVEKGGHMTSEVS